MDMSNVFMLMTMMFFKILNNKFKIMIKKLFLNIVILFSLSSCAGFYEPITLDLEVPDGPPDYRAGWYDGCRSGLSVKRFANAFVYDVSFGSGAHQHSPLYQSAWGSGWFSCYIGANTFVGMGPLAAGKSPFTH